VVAPVIGSCVNVPAPKLSGGSMIPGWRVSKPVGRSNPNPGSNVPGGPKILSHRYTLR
jgi:hypothetical protein